MNANKTILFTVAFPQPSRYYYDFFNSLKNQSSNFYDLLIINEGVDLSSYIAELPVQVMELVAAGTIAGNREIAFRYILDHEYENCICLDIDDFCMPNRISAIQYGLESCDLYVHDMCQVDEFGSVLQDCFIGARIPSRGINFNHIKDKNFIGFGNMGIKTKFLKYSLPFPSSISAIDWWVASIACLYGANVHYESIPLTFYRQYESNIAGTSLKNEQQAYAQLEIIILHYQNLLSCFDELLPTKSALQDHLQKLENFKKNRKKILSDSIINQTKPHNFFWWEEINMIVKGS